MIKVVKIDFKQNCTGCNKEKDLTIRTISPGTNDYDKDIMDLCNKCAHDLLKNLTIAIRK